MNANFKRNMRLFAIANVNTNIRTNVFNLNLYLCAPGVTDDDLRTITEEMFAADVNSIYDQLTLDYQGKGSSGDLAPGP